MSPSTGHGSNGCRRICLWSGPRNVSTALMYAFAQRPDTRVVDEPLYAHYLRTTGADHPGRDTVLAAQQQDGSRVVEETILGPCDRPVLFLKQMAHHLVDLDRAFLGQVDNVILTRDPREVIPTLSVQLGLPELPDTGYAQQVQLLDELDEITVLDARELLLNPEGVLKALCQQLDIGFDNNMLRWPAGERDFDGAWAPWWYHNVHRSTGFIPWQPKTRDLAPELEPLLAECLPLYERLLERALRA